MVLGLSLLSVPAFAATDYTTMTNSEMATLRGTMSDASQEDRDAFRADWQSRVSNMSQEERQSVTGRPASAAQDGSGSQYGKGSGNGRGGGMGRGRR